MMIKLKIMCAPKDKPEPNFFMVYFLMGPWPEILFQTGPGLFMKQVLAF
jgi:hypothetical protein